MSTQVAAGPAAQATPPELPAAQGLKVLGLAEELIPPGFTPLA